MNVAPSRWRCAAGGAAHPACASLPADKQPLPGETLSGNRAALVDASGEEFSTALGECTGLSSCRASPGPGRLELLHAHRRCWRRRWQPGRVVLEVTTGRNAYTSLDALTREVLGETCR